MLDSPDQNQTDRLADEFRARLGREPEAMAAAPGRVNLIGEHTDYNQGFVLPLAIDRTCRIAAAPSGSNEISVYSVGRKEEQRFSLCDLSPEPRGNFADYLRGVVAGFCATGASVHGFDAVIDSDVPLGSGLSSSAALEVATATLLENLTGVELPPLQKALLCQQAEHDFAGVPCGLMDQYSSVFGREDHLVLLDCRNNQSKYVALNDPDVELLVINTNVRHQLADSEYALRRQTCEAAAAALGYDSLRAAKLEDLEQLTGTQLKRARHVVQENLRTRAAAAAIEAGDWERAGAQMNQSHASLRDDFEVSCAELDAVVGICAEIGQGGGVYGARMTGGGFGGCAIALIRSADAAQIAARVQREYVWQTEIEPTLFTVRPGRGAHCIQSLIA